MQKVEITQIVEQTNPERSAAMGWEGWGPVPQPSPVWDPAVLPGHGGDHGGGWGRWAEGDFCICDSIHAYILQYPTIPHSTACYPIELLLVRPHHIPWSPIVPHSAPQHTDTVCRNGCTKKQNIVLPWFGLTVALVPYRSRSENNPL